MDIKELKHRLDLEQNQELYTQLHKLLMELSTKELPNETVNTINHIIDRVNSVTDSKKELKKQLKSAQHQIVKLIEQKHNFVIKHHYRNIWLAVGMGGIGIPIGLLFATSLDNMAFIGMGLPIGLSLGMAVGFAMDNRAFKEGRQIDWEI